MRLRFRGVFIANFQEDLWHVKFASEIAYKNLIEFGYEVWGEEFGIMSSTSRQSAMKSSIELPHDFLGASLTRKVDLSRRLPADFRSSL
jgi:hypothetical protein